MKRIAALLYILTIVTTVMAQLPTVRNFTTLDYAGGTQNWDITEGAEHRMFFANNNGLLAFDGDKWELSNVPNFTSVRSALLDEKYHRIFVGATDEFGYFTVDSIHHRVGYTSLSVKLPPANRQFGEIWHLLRVGSKIAFCGKTKVFIYNESGEVTMLDNRYEIENAAVVDDQLIISSLEGIFRYSAGGIRPLPGTAKLIGKRVRAVLPFGEKWLFVTDDDGMYIYNGVDCSPYVTSIDPFLKYSQVFCAAINKNYMAFGTVRDGVVVMNLHTGQLLYANVLTGLQNNTVLSMKFDRRGNLWLGLDNGIAYMLLTTPFRNLFGVSNNIGTGYASILFDGRLYLGTNQGLYVVDYPLKSSPVPEKPQYVDGINGQIWCLRQVGQQLFCGGNNGVFVISGTKATHIPGPTGTWNFLELRHHPGYVLGCDYNGLFVMKQVGGRYVMQGRVEGFGESSGNYYEDTDGTIWFSQWQKGIYHLWLKDDMTGIARQEYFHKGNGLAVDDNNLVTKIRGQVFISSVDGLLQYNRKTGRLEHRDDLNRIFNTFGVSLRIIETPDGDLWAYKPDYLAIAHPRRQGGYIVDTVPFQNVVRQLQMSLGHPSFPSKGQTILNYDNGFYLINSNVTHDIGRSRVFIRAITATTSDTDTTLYIYDEGHEAPVVRVPHSPKSVRIEFVMPEYRDAHAVSYSTYLEDYDDHWNVPQETTLKEYTQLERGSYTFHVKAHNLVNGQTDEAKIRIKVLPAWYETWMAYVVYVIFVIVAIYMLLRYLRRRANREVIRLREEKEQQLREQQERFQREEDKKEHELTKLRNEQLEVELKHKSGELADSTMNLVRKNDMLQEIDDGMQELYDSVRKEDPKLKLTRKIQEIRRGIKMNMNDDDNWEKFQENFNLVYDNYMQKLTSMYPDLKKNDLKLCAYLKMGLSSKEMTSLMNTSVRSVETARYRLRKKLGLDKGENLTNFLQNLDREANKENKLSEERGTKSEE